MSPPNENTGMKMRRKRLGATQQAAKSIVSGWVSMGFRNTLQRAARISNGFSTERRALECRFLFVTCNRYFAVWSHHVGSEWKLFISNNHTEKRFCWW